MTEHVAKTILANRFHSPCYLAARIASLPIFESSVSYSVFPLRLLPIELIE